MRKVLFLLLIMSAGFFTSCLSTYKLNEIDGKYVAEKASNPYTVTRIDDFEIEISGFKANRFRLYKRTAEGARRSIDSYIYLSRDGKRLHFDGWDYISKKKINSVRIVSERQIYFSSIEIKEESISSSEKTIIFDELNFGKNREKIAEENALALKQWEALQRQQAAPVMDNFWGISFGTSQKQAISEMAKKGCVSYAERNDSQNDSVLVFQEIKEYATTRPVRIELYFFQDRFYEAAVFYEDVNGRAMETTELIKAVCEKYRLEEHGWQTSWNPVRKRYVFTDALDVKKARTSIMGNTVRVDICTTTLRFTDEEVKKEKLEAGQKAKELEAAKRKADMLNGL